MKKEKNIIKVTALRIALRPAATPVRLVTNYVYVTGR